MIYVTSDHHFGHKNIIKYANRPFKNVEQMNTYMIQQWNKVVSENDVVYHLGDFALMPKKQTKKIMDQLKGYKILIRGNHDKGKKWMMDIGFNEYHKTLVHLDNFLLTHTPLYIEGVPLFNVSVDIWNYMPIPLPTTKQSLILHGHVHNKWVVKTW